MRAVQNLVSYNIQSQRHRLCTLIQAESSIVRCNKILVVLDESLAGDELDRVSRFQNDISSIRPIGSISGLIRHVEQVDTPLDMLAPTGDSASSASTQLQFVMRYMPCHSIQEDENFTVLDHEQVTQQLQIIFRHCSEPVVRWPTRYIPGLQSKDLGELTRRYDTIVCVRPVCGVAASLVRSHQLVCQLSRATGLSSSRIAFGTTICSS